MTDHRSVMVVDCQNVTVSMRENVLFGLRVEYFLAGDYKNNDFEILSLLSIIRYSSSF